MKNQYCLLACTLFLSLFVDAQIEFEKVKSSFSLAIDAKSLIENAEYESAKLKLDEALSLDSAEHEAYVVYTQLYYELSDYEKQKLYLKIATRVFNTDDQFYYYLGLVYSEEDKLDSAIYCYSKAIEFNNADYKELIIVPDYYASRGACYLKKNQFGLAIKDFTKAISLDELKSSAFANRGVAYYQSGQKQKACLSWEKASKLGESSVDVYIRKYCKDY